MGVQGIDTQTQLSRPLPLSCRIHLPCMDKFYTRAQAEPGPTHLLPNHLGLPQTNELGQCTPTGRYRPSSHQEDCCCRMERTRQTIDARHQLFHHRPAASRLKSRKSFMRRTVTPFDSSASNSRLQLWKDSLTDVTASVKMGLQVAESLPAGSGEDWFCWRALNRLRTGVGRAKTLMRNGASGGVLHGPGLGPRAGPARSPWAGPGQDSKIFCGPGRVRA